MGKCRQVFKCAQQQNVEGNPHPQPALARASPQEFAQTVVYERAEKQNTERPPPPRDVEGVAEEKPNSLAVTPGAHPNECRPTY